jgi:nitroreductase
MNGILEAIFQRRAVKVFEPVEISPGLREQILDAARHAPSSFNTQPYRFYWVGSTAKKAAVAKLCLGQMPAETASVLVVAVADIGSMRATSRSQVEWMRRSEFSEEKIRDYERDSKDRPNPVHARAVRYFRHGQKGNFLAAEFVEDDRNAAPVAPGHFQMGNEEYIAGLRKSDNRCRGAGNQHLSHGRL